MPVSGLVVTLSPASSPSDETPEPSTTPEQRFEALARLPGVALGPCVGFRAAIVMESESAEQDRERLEALRRVLGDGVVEIVFADFSDLESVPSGASYLQRSRVQRRRRRTRHLEVLS